MISTWWATLTGARVEPPARAAAVKALRIEAAGLCCAVGYHLHAAACAIRTNMDHFQNSEFMTETGHAINVGRLPDQDCWGSERVARWIARSVRDCLRDEPSLDASTVALVVLGPEPERPDMSDDVYAEIVSYAQKDLGMQFHPSSRILPLGKAGLSQALQFAAALVASPGISGVLLAAGDSLLNVAAIQHFLDHERLLVPGNRDGFLPAEAAAALLLRPALPGDKGVVIGGFAHATEEGLRDGENPNRSVGLTDAVRSACSHAGVDPLGLVFRVSDQNGEGYLSKEGSNAFTRIAAGGADIQHLTLGDKLGEIGAASGVAALAYLSHVMPRSDCSPGRTGVVHVSNDGGLRCAVVVQYLA